MFLPRTLSALHIVRSAAYSDEPAVFVLDLDVGDAERAPHFDYACSRGELGLDRHAQIVDTQIDRRNEIARPDRKRIVSGDTDERGRDAAMDLGHFGRGHSSRLKGSARVIVPASGSIATALNPKKR